MVAEACRKSEEQCYRYASVQDGLGCGWPARLE